MTNTTKQKIHLKLNRKYQPQWHFGTVKSAIRELQFQKKNNPMFYKWLITKDIEVSGKRISAKKIQGRLRK